MSGSSEHPRDDRYRYVYLGPIFILFGVQCGLISPTLILYFGLCFCSSADKTMLEQGPQESIYPQGYDER